MVRELGSGRGDRNREGKAPPRILMLVPHEPDDDPRIKWVAMLCAEIGRTDILSIARSTEKQARRYDGVTYVERVNMYEQSSALARYLTRIGRVLYRLGPIQRYVSREGRCPASSPLPTTSLLTEDPVLATMHPSVFGSFIPTGLRAGIARIDHHVGGVLRVILAWSWFAVLISALYRRARATSIVPRVLVCHDLHALIPGIMLKKVYGCPVIYDSHEFWPQADIIGQQWESGLLTRIERAAIRQADVVITVSPPLARHLESLYGLRHVLSVPNTEPFRTDITPSCARRPTWPVRVLLQGRMAPGRGIDRLLHAWSRFEDERAILCLQCPESPYFAQLRTHFSNLFGRGRVVLLSPVKEDQLVAAATCADVGIIPYIGPNLNHVYACPNKLSQYMHAGLAILSNKLDFVSEVINRYDCGLIYDADDPTTLIRSVKLMVSNLDKLHMMKRNAYDAARSEFNWQIQSRSYRTAIHDLYHRKGIA